MNFGIDSYFGINAEIGIDSGGSGYVYPLPTRNRVSIDYGAYSMKSRRHDYKINNFGTMGIPLPTLFSESMPALQIRLKFPPLLTT